MPWNVFRPNTRPNGCVPFDVLLRRYEPDVPLDSSNTSDSTQYENSPAAGVLPLFLTDSRFTPLRMQPTFQWLSMLVVLSPWLPPCPEYDEFHSVLNDITDEAE